RQAQLQAHPQHAIAQEDVLNPNSLPRPKSSLGDAPAGFFSLHNTIDHFSGKPRNVTQRPDHRRHENRHARQGD
ncbi:MAG TPA: hypothetical protein PLL01_03500, partial [Rhodoferax sp.]|nr:hypothetical protein [Rhodoferax sp.]